MGSPPYSFEAQRPGNTAQRALLEKHPLFFRAVASPPIYQCSLSHWGIECGKGWYSLIEEAAAKIEAELEGLLDDFCPQHHLRWLDKRLQNVDDSPLESHIGEDEEEPLIPFCAEVKAREGILHIYVRNGHICDGSTWLRIRAAVQEAEQKSQSTCEQCGRTDSIRHYSRGHVYCDSCFRGDPKL
jgi:hypothetical protein